MGEGDSEGSWSWVGEGSCFSGNTDFFWRTRKDTPYFTCRTICQPLLAARCVLRRLFDPSKLENNSRINKMCVISKCTEVYEESRTSVKQRSGGSKISETGGNPMGAKGPTNLLFDQIFQETCMKMKKVGHKVCAPPWIRQCKDSQWQSNSIPCHRSELHSIY